MREIGAEGNPKTGSGAGSLAQGKAFDGTACHETERRGESAA